MAYLACEKIFIRGNQLDLLGETWVKEATHLVGASAFSLRCGGVGQVSLKWMEIRQGFHCTVPFDKIN